MKIKFLCPYWGKEGTNAIQFIEEVVNAGFDGVEIGPPDDSHFISELKRAIAENNLVLVSQQYLPPEKETVDDYINRMEKLLIRGIELEPSFINSHTGKDHFTFEENCKAIDKCFELSEKFNTHINHETHRGRFNFCAALTRQYLDNYSELKLTADYSHWVTVSESFLEDQESSLNEAIKRSTYIHARIGHTQSPQVADPFAPENEIYLNKFLDWWQQILGNAKDTGQQEFYICPEFGPMPYMPTYPYSNKPISCQWDLNIKMMNYLKKELTSY